MVAKVPASFLGVLLNEGEPSGRGSHVEVLERAGWNGTGGGGIMGGGVEG